MSQNPYFVVRSVVVDESRRPEFDRWYGAEHLPMALKNFRIGQARRYWSVTDPAVHYAIYDFQSVEAINERMGSAEFKALLAAYDEAWPEGVTRTRKIWTPAGS